MIVFLLAEFAVGVVIGWTWQTITYCRLLDRSWPLLRVPTIANTQPPSMEELMQPERRGGQSDG